MAKSLVFQNATTVILFSLLLTACGSKGGGGGSSGGAPAAVNSCSSSVPTTDFTGLSTTEVQSAMANLDYAITTSDGRFVVPVTSSSLYKTAIWNGSQWSVDSVIPAATYTTVFGLELFEMNAKVTGAVRASSASLPLLPRFYTENSPSFDVGPDTAGFGSLAPRHYKSYDDTGKLYTSASSTNSLIFFENTVAGNYVNFTPSTIEFTASTNYTGNYSGTFSDHTALQVLTKVIGTATTLSIYRRTGAVWAKLMDVDSLSGSSNYLENVKVLENPYNHQLYIFWSNFTPSPQQTIQVKAAVLDLTTRSLSTPVVLQTILTPNFTNEASVFPALIPGSSDGAYAIHDMGKGLIWLGKITGPTIGTVEEYRPDLSFDSLSGFQFSFLGCDHKAVLTTHYANGASHLFTEVTANQYDGVPGN